MTFMQESRDPKYTHVKDLIEAQAQEIFKNIEPEGSPKNSHRVLKGLSRSTSPVELREPFFTVISKSKADIQHESLGKGNQSTRSSNPE